VIVSAIGRELDGSLKLLERFFQVPTLIGSEGFLVKGVGFLAIGG